MNAWLKVLGLLAIAAQWPPYQTARVPRTSDGTPNLTAPAPRTADGKPDLSGIWRVARGFGAGGLAGVGGAAGAPLLDGTIPPRTNQFWDIGFGLEGGLPLRPWAAALLKRRIDDNGKDNPDAHCLPMGNMQLHNHPQPRKIVQTPDLIVILYEGNAGIRQIFLDGRPLPANDPQPSCTAIRQGSGPATRSSSRRPGSETMAGSTSTAVR